ncbi:hypothetical protein Pan216_08540 [Planctomycetes bacterium Pan216]|uniref:Uncharacterized protein n=1 Tax=Kolteria novifilia TaxID=2527975 RepID=A0A518AZ58_9BACT|nr:hypothetical protein Pan216_08540 [Planctomycetes bacterium Pan216]
MTRRTTPPAKRHGWFGPDEAKRAFATLGPALPPFFIAGTPQRSERRRVVLWDYTRQANGGNHLPTHQQEIGDCVSMGAANAVDYLAAMEIVRLGDPERLRPAFPPYLYGISRVQVGGGRLENSDGSLGIWAADGVRRYGVLAADTPGVPEYSGAIATTWGKRPGPPEPLIAAASSHLVGTTAQVTTYAAVRDALANGYPITVASTQGFLMRPRVDRGKHWGVPRGRWAHQMCLIGVDDSPERPGCYCLNSWGPDAHGRPADDAPPGGFWIDASIVDAMVAQGDSFAFSQFDGFPRQDLDFHLI